MKPASSMLSMKTAILSIILEQHAQVNGLLLSVNEFSWFQVNVSGADLVAPEVMHFFSRLAR